MSRVTGFVGTASDNLSHNYLYLVEDTDVTYQDLRAAGMTDRVINGIRALTKQPGQTYEEYKQGVFASRDAMLVKSADLRHNTDIRRLKGVTEKDIARMAKYHTFYLEIQSRLNGGANEQDE